MKKLSLFLVFMSLLVAFQIKKGDRVDVNINANGDFNVSEGNFTVEKGYINSVNSGAYIKIKPKDINSSYALMVGGDVWIDGTIYYNEPILSIESSKTIKETNDDQTLQIKVKLSYAISKDVTFKVKTYDGSGDDGAVAGEDYDSIDDKYTIKAGDTETTINVTIKGDDLYEYDDKFKVEISDVQNAQLGNDTCDVTIENDDEKPTISVKEDVSAKEDVDPDFEVDLSKKAGVPVTFHIKMTHDTTDDNDNRLQLAQNSKFKYNGVEIERDSNQVEDLIIGVKFDLKSTGISNINIKQDTTSIEQAVQDFVTGYNSLVSKIQDLTKFDTETKATGIFQGESTISNITRDLSRNFFNSFVSDTITKQDKNGEDYHTNILLNATDFGFTMNRTGFMDFDSSKFADMLKNKPEKLEEFLSGDEGVFTKTLNSIDSLIKGSNSSLELLSSQYNKEEKSYQDTIDKTQARIDIRYQTMAAQFASYDSIINSYNIQSQTITQAIEAMIAAK